MTAHVLTDTGHAAGTASVSPASRIVLRPGLRTFWSVTFVGALLVMSLATLLITERPVLAALPLLLGLVAVFSLLVPLRVPFYVIVATAIVADLGFPEGMDRGHPYARAVRVLNWLLLENLNKLTGIEALRLSGMEVLIVLMLAIVAFQALVTAPSTTDRAVTFPQPLGVALAISLVVLMAAEAWGIARGGDFRQSLWQFRYLGWLPILTLVATQVLRRDEVLPELGALITGVGLIKAALGLFVFVWSIQAGQGRPHSTTSHADTALFCIVFALWAAQITFRPSTARVLVGALVMGSMLAAIVVNNRRTAFVTLPVLLLLLLMHLPARRRARVLTLLFMLAPLLAGYVVVGHGRTSSVFIPANMVWSVSRQDDASSDSREVENANLALTLRAHPITGTGFGHPYATGDRGVYDLSELFAQYRFVAHNSVLWLFAIAGPVGATLLWMPHVLALFLAARVFRTRASAFDQVAAYMIMATVTAYLLQAWADMGTQGWTGTVVLVLAFVTTGLVVSRTGVLPASLQLLRWRTVRSPNPSAGVAYAR